MTQIVTEHGILNTYKKRINKTNKEKCQYCNANKDIAKHTMFNCSRWKARKSDLDLKLETIVNNFKEILLESDKNQNIINEYIIKIMKIKLQNKKELEKQQTQGTRSRPKKYKASNRQHAKKMFC